ncbi:hypothetical protein VTJ04DRAFT_1672 [Mycothermus thermophilus]|uniref:uncharacterized protein n=1 Tax=Humicola insolens TaxID=85995 RepID=UPI003744542B
MKKINKARHHHLPNCTHKTFDHTTPDVHRQIIVSTTHVRVLFATNNSNSQPQPITKCLYRTTQPSQVEQENPAAEPAGYIISLWFFVVPPPPCFHLPRYQLPTNPNLFLSPPLSGRVGSTSGRSYLNRPRTASPVRVHCSCAASTNLPSSLLGRRADPNAGPHIPPNPKLPSLSHLLSFSSRTCA